MMNQIDDDWFYDSIRSYKTLFMYELRMNPLHMARLEKNSLCISGHNDSKNMSELIEVSMPEKLFLSENDANLCKNNDFEMESGQFLKSEIYMMKSIAESEKTVVSFENFVGLTIFDFQSEHPGESNKVHTLQTPSLLSPNFATHRSEDEIIVTKNVSDKIFKINCSTGQETNFNMPEELTTTPGEVLCDYSDSYTLALLHTSNGSLATLDTRCFDYNINNSEIINKSNYVLSNVNNNQIATLSSQGNIKIFDKRHKNKILIKTELDIPCADNKYMKINLTSDNRCSVSGFDNFVYIYDTSGSNFQQIFKHCGHNEAEDIIGTIVTDHFWLSEVSTNLVVSCAKNGTLNCWEYVV